MQYKDYYKILGVDRDAGADQIKAAYRKLARKYHPDVSKENDSENKFKEVGEAYEVLKDQQKRAAYDQLGSNWRAGQDFRAPAGFGGAHPGAGDASAFSDFFESLFGGGPAGGHPGGGFARRGADQRTTIEVSLNDAYNGSQRSISLQTPDGSHKTLNIKIPKGINDGQSIRLQGQGGQGMGGPPGNLLIEIRLAAHPLYVLNGKNLEIELPVTPWEAALGAKVTVPTLAGDIGLTIPADSNSGRKMRLKGKGWPGKPTGDLYVKLKVMLPSADSDVARQLYREMAEKLDFDPRAALKAKQTA